MFDVDVNPEHLEKFTHNSNQDKFVTLNLLKFKADGGKEDYARYLKESSPFASGIKEALVRRKSCEIVENVVPPV